MHTEAQAKLLWCPHGRIALKDGVTINDPQLLSSPEDYACRCIASKCAAWRWADPTSRYYAQNDGLRGYCGLAGKALV